MKRLFTGDLPPGMAGGGGGSGIGGSTGSTDNRALRSDGTGGSTVQASAVTIDDTGNTTFGVNAAGWFQGLRRVLPFTSDDDLFAQNSGSIVTNDGASVNVSIALPPATIGLWYTAVVDVAHTIFLAVDGTDVFRIGAAVTTLGTVAMSSLGARLDFSCSKTGLWVGTSSGTVVLS